MEHGYYEAVARWLLSHTASGHGRFERPHRGRGGEQLTSADVVAWGAGLTPGTPPELPGLAGVEVKQLAWPFGAEGYKAFGQALHLARFTNLAYVAYSVPLADPGRPDQVRVRPPDLTFLRHILSDASVPLGPVITRTDYLALLRRVYLEFFGDTPVGLLSITYSRDLRVRNDRHYTRSDNGAAVSVQVPCARGRLAAFPTTGTASEIVSVVVAELIPAKFREQDEQRQVWWLGYTNRGTFHLRAFDADPDDGVDFRRPDQPIHNS